MMRIAPKWPIRELTIRKFKVRMKRCPVWQSLVTAHMKRAIRVLRATCLLSLYTPYVFSQAHCELASNVHGLSWSRRVCSFPEPATLSDNSSARLPSSINQPRRIVQSNSQYLSISRHRKFLLQIPEGLGGFATSLGGSSDSYDNRYYRGSKGGTTTRP
ncbi:hypothetical protein F4824DRAFT_357505 [Ustulina deusta]|nr:hypothetical protein F4824DRAFT_357505 [Ustulina deusta]